MSDRTYAESITLRPMDLLQLPDGSTKTIGAIAVIRHDRATLRLDQKFAPSVYIEVVTRGLIDNRPVAAVAPRWQSREPAHWRADLSASLDVALVGGEARAIEQAAAIISSIDETGNPFVYLEEVRDTLGPRIFGTVARFQIEAQTSLMNASQILTATRSLAEVCLQVADLGWPESVLKGQFSDQAAEADSAFEARFAEAIQEWKGYLASS